METRPKTTEQLTAQIRRRRRLSVAFYLLMLASFIIYFVNRKEALSESVANQWQVFGLGSGLIVLNLVYEYFWYYSRWRKPEAIQQQIANDKAKEQLNQRRLLRAFRIGFILSPVAVLATVWIPPAIGIWILLSMILVILLSVFVPLKEADAV